MQKLLLNRHRNYVHRKILEKESIFLLAIIKLIEEMLESNVRKMIPHRDDDDFFGINRITSE